MNEELVPVGRMLMGVLAVLALSMVVALVGLVTIGVTGGDPGVRDTLTHLVETVIGVLIGITAGRLAATE